MWPGVRETDATLRPTNALSRDVLPTFGWPTNPTVTVSRSHAPPPAATAAVSSASLAPPFTLLGFLPALLALSRRLFRLRLGASSSSSSPPSPPAAAPAAHRPAPSASPSGGGRTTPRASATPSTYSRTVRRPAAESGAPSAFRREATPPPSEPPTSLPLEEKVASRARGKRRDSASRHRSSASRETRSTCSRAEA